MTSLTVAGRVVNMRSVSMASASRCMESWELAKGESSRDQGESSRDVVVLRALFSLTDSNVISSSAGDVLHAPAHIQFLLTNRQRCLGEITII